MIKKASIKRLFVLIGLALGLFLAPVSTIYAQSNEATSDGLEIGPALVEVNATRGKSYTVELKVLNVTKSTLIFDSSVDDFGAKDESGAPGIILDVDSDLPTSIKTWVDAIPSFSLNANESKKFKVTIDVPSNAEPGGHYGVIRFAGRAPDADATIGQVASAGTLVLIRVDGTVTETLELDSFSATKSGGDAATTFESGPLVFVSRFKNTGTVHVKPVGQIEIRGGLTNTRTVIPVNKNGGNVLPNSIRRFESQLNTTWMFGRYTADISIAYGTTGQAIVKTISFWVIPYKLVLIALLVLITLIYVLRGLVKRYNTYIIKQAQKSQKTQKSRKKN